MSEILQMLAKEISDIQERQKAMPFGLANGFGNNGNMGYKADGVVSETAYIYETGGLFGRCDGPATLINALVAPIGFEKVLQWVGTNTEREFVEAWTSIGTSGNEQSTVCGDCISPTLSVCSQHYCFGRFCRQTQEMQFDRLGVMANENVPVKVLFGNITDAAGNVLLRQGDVIRDGFILQSRAAAHLIRLRNSQMIWNGNPINNNGRVYMEFNGFDQIINTGKVDDKTQIACDGLDSFLLNYANNNPQSDDALAITNYFRRIVNQLATRADRAGLDWDSSTMYIVMTPNTWDCVARAYACQGIDLCTTNSATMNADNTQAQARYEEYLNRMALPVNGRWYPVVLDNNITQTTGQTNGICSDIYFITTDINGETVTFGQYQDFNKTYGAIRNELVSMFGSDDIAITDNGRFALVRDNSRGCFDVQIYIKPRLVAMMPFLLGRLQNVCCNVLGEPFPDPSGSGRTYEKGGGRTTSPIPTLYGC